MRAGQVPSRFLRRAAYVTVGAGIGPGPFPHRRDRLPQAISEPPLTGPAEGKSAALGP